MLGSSPFFSLLFALQATASQIPHNQRPHVKAVPRTSAIVVDGVFDEPTWQTAPVATNFVQFDPNEGQPATQKTEVKFAYDDDALYIAARMWDDKAPSGIRTFLTRRDNTNAGDYLQFVFDTYHDHAGRTSFLVNPSGVKNDAGQAAPQTDPSWDPVWELATKIDDKGWSAEFRIPWAQLRFPKDSIQTWGVQIWRYVERLNETSMYSPWGKKDIGGPQYFAHIEDLHPGHKPGGVELLPYVVGKAAYEQSPDPGSPFFKKNDYGWRAGGDVKALLTSTLTLDATVNPDFGQVEADPAVVNLSAFETFFPEKRPFFISGNGIFGFGSFNCFYCSNVSSMSLFYSRRIGRSPQGFVDQPALHTLMPDNTTILGAGKITGRTAGGLQIGLLNALTASEKAKAISPTGNDFQEEVEPLTNYFVGRVKKTYHHGDYTFGAIGTSVARKFDNPTLQSLLPGHAEAGGLDWNMGWKNRTYTFMGNFALSDVNGDSAVIRRLERSSARYFQRPDRVGGSNGFFTNSYDRTLTDMRGYGGYARVAKDGGSWLTEAQVNYRSPGFETNDLAFLTQADYFWMNANVLKVFTKPTKYYRSMNYTLGAQQQHNYEGDLTGRQIHAAANYTAPFYWSLFVSGQVRPAVYDDRMTRGGAVVRRPQVKSFFGNIQSDFRKNVVFTLSPSWNWTADGGSSFSISGDVTMKPVTNVKLEFTPSYSRNFSTTQFVRNFTDASATAFYGIRSVFAGIDQKSVEFDTRVSATFTPTLSLEMVLQPFVSTGSYHDYNEFVKPRALDKHFFDATQLTANKDASGRVTGYTLDPDRNAATANFSFNNPDFNFRSLLGNAVLRWEYRPGSTLYLVWQQSRNGSEPFGDFDFSRDSGAIFRQHPDNIFLLKVSYWLQR